MAAIVTHDSFGVSGCSGGVKNVQRIGRVDDDAVMRLCCRHDVLPVDISSGDQVCLLLWSLQDDAGIRFM